MEALVTTWNVGTELTIVWRVPGSAVQKTWHGTVLTITANKKAATIRYRDQGAEPYDFPPASDEALVDEVKVTLPQAKPSMKRTVELTDSNVFNELDITSWSTLMKERVGLMLLLDKIRARFAGPAPDLNTKAGRDHARDTNYFEKDNLLWVLEGWMLEHMGQENLAVAPKCNVAFRILSRLHAHEVAEKEGGSVRRYCQAARAVADPKDFKEFRKAALTKGGPKNEET